MKPTLIRLFVLTAIGCLGAACFNSLAAQDLHIPALQDSVVITDTVIPEETADPQAHLAHFKSVDNRILADSIIEYASKYTGKNYRRAGTGKGGFDCSGFVCHVMIHFGYRLPHSSAAQGLIGVQVPVRYARKGDLVFFKGRNARSKRIGHVGIVIENRKGEIIFIHASVQDGVRIDSSMSPYYKKRLVSARRILKPPVKHEQ